MDLSMTAYLLLLPWLCSWLCFAAKGLESFAWNRFAVRVTTFFRYLLLVFHFLASLAVVACILGDIALYPFWGFKLDATIWTYIDSPRDAVASVSVGFVILYLAVFLLLSASLFLAGKSIVLHSNFNIQNPKIGERPNSQPEDSFLQSAGSHFNLLLAHLAYALVGGLLFIALRGGVTESTMNVGNAYFSDRQFLNHAAVNPVFSLLASSLKAEHFDQLYRTMSDAEATAILDNLYPITACNEANAGSRSDGSLSHSHSSLLLSPPTPSILLIFWEGGGGQLTASLGGPTGENAFTPNLDSLARTGIFFSELRANSFRTDRGTLCTLSGHVSFPTHSLMKMATRASHLPSIAHTLQEAGYVTSFTYGGDINFTNMKGYLLSTGFQHITADTDFSRADRATAKWGVCDSILFLRLYDQLLQTADASPFFTTALTLSSHEPWDVPSSYRRVGDVDEKVASFRYTDHHLGRFIHRLRQTPLWDNLLVIIMPDHGVIAADVTSRHEPRFIHIPMVWTGGAINQPRTIPVLMNQSDLPATLLGQMGLPHDGFPWSRDVLSTAYTRPFAYFTFNDGFATTAPSQPSSSSLTTVFFDNTAQAATTFGDAHQTDSLTRLGKAILQRSYDHLEQLR